MHGTHWILAGLLLVADVVGVGIMEIPGNLARVGWLVGLPVLAIFLPLNLYTGLLLGRLKLVFPNEASASYGALAGAVFGPVGRVAIGAIVYTKILLALGAFLLVLTQALQGVFNDVELCQPYVSLFAGVVLLPLNQLRTLTGVAIISAVSFVTVLAAIAICVVSLLAGANPKYEGPDAASEAVATSSDFFTTFAAGSGFVFAYVGHAIYLEIASEMKRPERFSRALTLSAALIGTSYLAVGIVAYASAGALTPSFLLDVLPYDWSRRIANALLFVHVLISYTISNQVMTRAVLRCAVPSSRCATLRVALNLSSDDAVPMHQAIRTSARTRMGARLAAAEDGGGGGEGEGLELSFHSSRSGSRSVERGGSSSSSSSSSCSSSIGRAEGGVESEAGDVDDEVVGGAGDGLNAGLIVLEGGGGKCGAVHLGSGGSVSEGEFATDADVLGAKLMWPMRLAAAAVWFLCSTTLFCFAWVVANGLPFFAELTGILGAVSHTPIGLLFPALFTLAVAHGAGAATRLEPPQKLGILQYVLCVVIIVFSCVLICLGLVANIRSAALKVGDEGLPFECHCRAESCLEE